MENPKFYFLVDNHLTRDKIDPVLQKDYVFLLETAPKIINVFHKLKAMIEISYIRMK